jgi:hypothetical protein
MAGKNHLHSSSGVREVVLGTIHVCPVSCNVVVMFTRTLVRSHPDSRRRWGET